MRDGEWGQAAIPVSVIRGTAMDLRMLSYAFVILEESPPPPEPATAAAESAPEFLVLSARNKKALDAATARLGGWLREHPDVPLSTVSYTLSAGRKRFEQRRVVAARGPVGLVPRRRAQRASGPGSEGPEDRDR